MKDDQRERAFLAEARRALEEEAEHVDAATLSRLRAARHRAVADAGGAAARRRRRMGLAATAVAGLLAAVALSVMTASRHPPAVPTADNAEDMDLLTGAEGLQFYRDLEFYRWLDNEQDAG